MLPRKKALLIHHKDKTSSAIANRCWCFAEASAIDNAKTPNITNLHTLVANQSPFLSQELRYFENIKKEMIAFFLSKV